MSTNYIFSVLYLLAHVCLGWPDIPSSITEMFDLSREWTGSNDDAMPRSQPTEMDLVTQAGVVTVIVTLLSDMYFINKCIKYARLCLTL